jgi:type VI secretion system protein ImpI
MTVTLSVLRCPDAVPPETRKLTGGEFSIGRGPDNDWTLADPDRYLSKRHCVLAYRSGFWQLADVSTNGTFLNRDVDAVGQGVPRDLRDGDRIRMGNYEIEVRIAAEASSGWAPAAAQPARGRNESFGADPFGGDPFGDDPFNPKPPPPSVSPGFGADPMLHRQGSVRLPSDFDPLGPDFDAPFTGPTKSDHASPLEHSFQTPMPMGPGIPADLDDWDLDLSPKAAPPPPMPAPPPARIVPPVVLPIMDEPVPDAVVPPAEAPPDPFAETGVAAVPLAAPEPRVAPRPAVPRDPSAPDDLMAAFLRGAGMDASVPEDPVASMQALGEAFRAMVGGLRQALIARATVKGEFRIEQTMIRARGNNPLKFSAGDDDALASLIGTGRSRDMSPAVAIAEVLRDMRLHELATMAAMQSGVRALLARFDPAALRAEGEKAGGLLAAQKRARAFESFEKLHAEITHALADDFDSVFGKAFARAYEQALREVADKERP